MKAFISILLLISLSAFAKEDRTRIAVIDTGIRDDFNKSFLCNEGHKGIDNHDVQDNHGHGTMIASNISRYINYKTHCLLIIKWIDPNREQLTGDQQMKRVVDAVTYAISQKVKFINMSLSGDGDLPNERKALQTALDSGILVAVASGNKSTDLSKNCHYYPACYNFKRSNFRVVASYKGDVRRPESNYGGPVTDTEDGEEGNSSKATAIFLGKYIRGAHANDNKDDNSRSISSRLR